MQKIKDVIKNVLIAIPAFIWEALAVIFTIIAGGFSLLLALAVAAMLLTFIVTLFTGAFILCLKFWTCVTGGFRW